MLCLWQLLYSTSYCSSHYEIANNFTEKDDKIEYCNDAFYNNIHVAEIQHFDNNRNFNYNDEYLKEFLTNNTQSTIFSNDIIISNDCTENFSFLPFPSESPKNGNLDFHFISDSDLGTSSNHSNKTCCKCKKILDCILCKKKQNFYTYEINTKINTKELHNQIRKIVDDLIIEEDSKKNNWFTNFYKKSKNYIKKIFCKNNETMPENKAPLIKHNTNLRKNSLNLESNTTDKLGNINKVQRKMSADILNKILFNESSKYHIIDHSNQELYLSTSEKEWTNFSYIKSINEYNRKYSDSIIFENDQIKYGEDYKMSMNSSTQSTKQNDNNI